MKVYSKEEARYEFDSIANEILNGSIFIYPTDTVYGIGCNALDAVAVKKLRSIKQRSEDFAFSVIAPSLDWIREHCEINDEGEEWLSQLPGPTTLVFRLDNKECVSNAVNPGKETLGVRVPDHWISEFVKAIGVPIITTSVNVHGGEMMTSLENVDLQIKRGVQFAVYEGENKGRPSALIFLNNGHVKVRKR